MCNPDVIDGLESAIEKLEIERNNLLFAIEWLNTEDAVSFLEDIEYHKVSEVATALYEKLTGLV